MAVLVVITVLAVWAIANSVDVQLDWIADSSSGFSSTGVIAAEGENLRAVPLTLAVTMDRYTHLFPAATEALAQRMDTMRAAAVAFSRAPSAPPAVIDIRPNQQS